MRSFRQMGLAASVPEPRTGPAVGLVARAAATARDVRTRKRPRAAPGPHARAAGAPARSPAGSASERNSERAPDERRCDPEGEVIAPRQRRRRRMAAVAEGVACARLGKRREHGQPERAADLGGRVDEPRREPGVLLASRRTSRRSSAPGRRCRRRPPAAPSRAARRGRSCRGRRRGANSASASHDQRHPGQQRVARAEARDDPLGVADRERPHRDRDRQEGEPDLRARRSRARAAGRARRGRTCPNIPATDRIWIAVRGHDRARAEDAQRHERMRRARLPQRRTPASSASAQRAQGERAAVAPAVRGGGADDRVDADHQRGGDQHARPAASAPRSRPMPVARRRSGGARAAP